MTQTGALLGREYMSPEQARGQKAEAHSDVFTLGIIFYELLTGERPNKVDTPLAVLLKRTQERARPAGGVGSNDSPVISAMLLSSVWKLNNSCAIREPPRSWRISKPGAHHPAAAFSTISDAHKIHCLWCTNRRRCHAQCHMGLRLTNRDD